ncbi:hypothetical protein Rs2_10946 [Raphanus sativus]|uniref:Uncharacterized protein LOC108845423 n=1 Tax=Raphanus sativus TaxID=3726 RepID=A0A9W3DF88_RAPSA|nr:uncharacterized protein LOC108845423 [Raphanus sativus]KAJ4907288.1 hypothetical protein Rs2_10946 [Raphanus sativus]
MASIGRLMITDFSGPSCWTRVLEKTVPLNLIRETGTKGASYGWIFTLKEDGTKPRLVDDLNPGVSESDGCEISLPDLVTLPHCQTRLVTNVAMSSSSPHDENCILAVKFAGPQLSLCRPAQENNKWVNIRIDDPGFFSSRVMYSKRDKKFAMPSFGGGSFIGYWDLGENLEKPKGQHFSDYDNPELLPSHWERLDSCCTSVELVESRATDEMFMIKRFRENGYNDGRMEEYRIWVFKQVDSSSQWFYIKNIEDLCIFRV